MAFEAQIDYRMVDRDGSPGICFAHLACAARRSASLRAAGLTFRHRAAPRATAVR